MWTASNVPRYTFILVDVALVMRCFIVWTSLPTMAMRYHAYHDCCLHYSQHEPPPKCFEIMYLYGNCASTGSSSLPSGSVNSESSVISETTARQLDTVARYLQDEGEALGEHHVASHMLPIILAGKQLCMSQELTLVMPGLWPLVH
jgi:hypothetical protein